MDRAAGAADLTPEVRRHDRIAIGVGGASLLLLLAGLFLTFLARTTKLPAGVTGWDLSSVGDYIEAMGTCVLGALIAFKRPSNAIGWVFLAAAATLGLGHFGNAYAPYALIVRHGSLPAGKVIGFIANLMWTFPIAMLILLLLLFPTGATLTRRWRWVAVADLFFAGFVFVSAVPLAVYSWNRPWYSPSPAQLPGFMRWDIQILFSVYIIAIPLLLVAAMVGVVLRFRRSRGDERLQLKWFTFATSLVVCAFVVSTITNLSVASVVQSIALMALWAAIAIAMLKYRLFDIDIVIRKTVVGAVLVACITAVYAILVAGIGALSSQANVFKSGPVIAATTAVIAIAFQPVLRWARRFADQLLYGKRATPYEVLSEFSDQMGETYATDELPQRMARILAEGTGATSATVWLRVGAELRPTGTWPVEAPVQPATPVPSSGQDPDVPEAGRTFAVRHHGELLGALSITMPPEEPLNAVQEKLCSDLAAQAGLVLRNVRLIEELRASRQRLVAAQDAERRKLERNIHDGAQQQLVSLGVKLNLVDRIMDADPAKGHEMLADLKVQTNEALQDLRDLARGIYPPLLADQGLEAALEAQARKAAVPVAVESDGIGRHTQDVEAAVYFCCLEALQNIGKYAGANSGIIRLHDGTGTLTFEVVDDGHGFDPASTGYGTGLQGMADRLDALGGSLEIKSEPGHGTTVVGRLPAASTAG